MHTPFFPLWRARLAALGRRVEHLRQQSLAHLEQLLGPWLPPGLLSQCEQGPNSRDRIYSLRRTFFGFLYQVLKPETAPAAKSYAKSRRSLACKGKASWTKAPVPIAKPANDCPWCNVAQCFVERFAN